METKVWHKIKSKILIYGGSWEDGQTSIRAKVFEVMFELAMDKVKDFKSDLYHDAMWLNEVLTGPRQFDWAVRDSGTFIGDTATCIKDIDWQGLVRYRLNIYNDDGRWVLEVYKEGNSETEDLEIKEPLLLENEEWSLDLMMKETQNFPIHRNEESTIKGKMNMDIIENLREKLEEASLIRDELTDKRYDVNEAIDELNIYIDDVESLIRSLRDLPIVSIAVEVDLQFDSC